MKSIPLALVSPPEARRLARLFPSYRDFVDDALFHPDWGYYSTGIVRFGEGGHYDTFPLALSPMFGRMLAGYGYRLWRRYGQPQSFEICEIGAGNGQLCLDVLVAAADQVRRQRDANKGRWAQFARLLRYRIIERSPALIIRQRKHLGPLAGQVTWTQADLSQRAARGTPLADYGLVLANEVLDCLAHHKVVPQADGQPGVVFVVPTLHRGRRAQSGRLETVPGLRPDDRALLRAGLAQALGDARLRWQVSFHEVLLPVTAVPGLRPFLRRHYPEFFRPGRFPPYFACPAIETLIRNAARLYDQGEELWIDYGDTRSFHLTKPDARRMFAGPPRSNATVYRAPGLDDITFMVDFSVVGGAAEDAGLAVDFYGGQGELARRSGVRFDRHAANEILRYRALGWMLALVGVGPERLWRQTGWTWGKRPGSGGPVRADIRRGIAEFMGERRSAFKLMILRRKGMP
ncbi:MAG: SAM-dependent methyltransferase [Deltaproteobacteria bacterium]|nr:SAM-dependent methyltransferase [Deltaproteobacteria bacterium]